MGKAAFGLVRNDKSLKFFEGNYKVAWDRLINKYASNTATSLLKLKGKFKFKMAMNSYE